MHVPLEVGPGTVLGGEKCGPRRRLCGIHDECYTRVDDPTPFYSRSTCGPHLQLLHCVTRLCPSQMLLLLCNKTSCVFNLFFFLFPHVFMFGIPMLFARMGEKTMRGFLVLLWEKLSSVNILKYFDFIKL